MSPKIKKRDNSTELPRLVSLLNSFQVVRMVELLRTFGICGVYQRAGGIGGSIQITKYKTTSYTRHYSLTFISCI